MKNKLKLILSCSVLSLSAISASAVFAAPSDNCVNQVSMNFTADNWVRIADWISQASRASSSSTS